MDFSITTKYDIGDKVYIAEFYDEYMPSRAFTITTIEINIKSNITKVYYYLNKGDDYKSYYLEESLFATCAECTEWCEKHNNNS